MKIYERIDEIIGKTPLLKLNRLKKEFNLKADIYAKLEYFNPAGSVKDRTALQMIKEAEEGGKIKKGGTFIEPTSGNTGIGIAMLTASLGYKAVIVMPDSMSKERISLIKAYGAEVVLTDGKKGMKGAIDKAIEMQNGRENSIILSQFDNPANPMAHYLTTAREIESDLEGDFDYLIAGIGTGGTACGCGKYFKENNLKAKVIGVEPESSPLITKGKSGPHKIQGIGANFIPKNYKEEYIDGVETVSDDEAIETARILARTEGVFAGISSGGALSVAIRLAKKEQNEGKKLVVIITDTGERYLSADLF